jgi:pre-mRNA-processing factor 8
MLPVEVAIGKNVLLPPSDAFTDLFMNPQTWLVDETCVYRVTIHKTWEGNLSTKPITGALFILHPRTGHLYSSIVTPSVWQGLNRLGTYGKMMSALEVVKLIDSLPVDQQPKQIISSRGGFLEPLKIHLRGHDDIALRQSNLYLPLQVFCSKNRKIKELMDLATEPVLHTSNLYDDWLKDISSYTCFSRLALILRALHVNSEKAEQILSTGETLPQHFWPSFSHEGWIQAEIALKDIIVSEYCRKRPDLDRETLNMAAIRDIILRDDHTISSAAQRLVPVEDSRMEMNDNLTGVLVCPIEISPTDTIAQLKDKLWSVYHLPSCQQWLYFKGKLLDNSLTVADYDLMQKDAKVQMELRPPRN